jgi:hypothetical protein
VCSDEPVRALGNLTSVSDNIANDGKLPPLSNMPPANVALNAATPSSRVRQSTMAASNRLWMSATLPFSGVETV